MASQTVYFDLPTLLLFVVSSGGISALVSKLVLERMKTSWNHSADKKLESLKGEISQNNSIVLSLIGQSGQSRQKIVEKQIESVQVLWECTKNISRLVPAMISHVNNILTHQEVASGALKHTRRGSSYEEDILQIDKVKYFNEAFENLELLQSLRPFIGPQLNLLVTAYNAMIGRMVYLLMNAAETEKVVTWNADSGMIQIFESALTKQEVEFLKNGRGVNGFNIIVDLMEQKILSEISKLISGASIVDDALAVVDKMRLIESANNQGSPSG
ncbi:hypothetical protein [Dyadobacter sp. MSC1_007]|jgi:hypothetical protein|uniref:hypothetical protein n=1 Tax=Dyadobacter sp. MSC1_007 TaxID=2909264 RepID=UPI0020304A3F|nr:hypothetical protein [Dyadobacter sp. MSC1_007]